MWLLYSGLFPLLLSVYFTDEIHIIFNELLSDQKIHHFNQQLKTIFPYVLETHAF